jgi:hypothetical protein
LSLLRAAAIVFAVLFALGGAFGVNRRADAINRVRTSAAQLLALQDIRVRVVHADAIASSSYLVGGQEDPAQRTAYLEEIARAGDGLVAVSGAAADADVAALSDASRLLGSYVGLVEQARANNRQGFPVGAAYQRQANGIVTNTSADVADVVSSLRAVEASQRSQINAGLAVAHRAGAWLHVLGWLLLAGLVVASVWLSRTFRRVVNVPIALAAIALLLLLVIGGSLQGGAVSDADDAVAHELTGADRAAQARGAAFEARSQEALTLINRGNGAGYEANWKAADATVADALDRGVAPDGAQTESAKTVYAAYEAGHRDIRDLDDAGQWEHAVAVSLGREATASGTNVASTFDDFDRAVGQIAADEGATASARLSDAVDPLATLRNVVFLVGLAVAVLAALGFGQRLREYR